MSFVVKAIIGKEYGSTVCQFEGRSEWKRIQRSQLQGALHEESDEQQNGSTEELMDDDDEIEEDNSTPESSTTGHVGHSRAVNSALKNAGFLSKTKFSQEKYLRKKHQKYSKEITMLKPSLRDFCEAGMTPVRADMAGSLLRFAGVRQGSVVGLVDDGIGIVTTGLLQRVCEIDRYVLGKATGTERAQCVFNLDNSPLTTVLNDLKDPNARFYDSLVIVNSGQAEASIEEVFDALNPKLKVSGTLVIYSCYIEPLLALVYKLRANPEEGQEIRFINVQLTEQMLREHEIVKERTHPIMKQSIALFRGFILSAIKVFV